MMLAPFFSKWEAGFWVWTLKGQAHPEANEMHAAGEEVG